MRGIWVNPQTLSNCAQFSPLYGRRLYYVKLCPTRHAQVRKVTLPGGTKEGLDRAAIWNWHGHARHTIVISDRANIGGRSDEATYEAEQRALFR